MQTRANVTRGELTIMADDPVYRGTLTIDQGNNVLPLRSLVLTGSVMNMVVQSPEGNVVFNGTLNPDANSFQGTVTYHTGANFPVSGSRTQ